MESRLSRAPDPGAAPLLMRHFPGAPRRRRLWPGSGGGTSRTGRGLRTRRPTARGPPQTPLTDPEQTTPPTRPSDSYLSAGVVDQVFPPGTKATELLAAGQCAPLLRRVEKAEAHEHVEGRERARPTHLLYTAAAQACMSHWSTAQTTFQKVVLPIDCGLDVTNDP